MGIPELKVRPLYSYRLVVNMRPLFAPAVLAAGCPSSTRNTISTIYPARRLRMIKFIRFEKRAVVSEREFRHGSSRPKGVERDRPRVSRASAVRKTEAKIKGAV